MRIKIVIVLIAFCFGISCAEKSNDIESVFVTDLQKVLNTKEIQLLDVRTQAEFDQGAIKGAMLADVKRSDFYEVASGKLDKDTPVYVYCRSGKRSEKASEILHEKGFKVITVTGGFMAWKSKK